MQTNVKKRICFVSMTCLTALKLSGILAAQVLEMPEERAFYRVIVDGIPVDRVEMSPDGVLSWPTVDGSLHYIVQRSDDLVEWLPYTRGLADNPTTSAKVADFKTPPGMVFLPGGRFTMGDILGDEGNTTQVHSVHLSPFYMNAHENTLAEVAKGLQWGYEKGSVKISADGKAVLGSGGILLMKIDQYDSNIEFVDGRFIVLPGQGNFPAPYISWYGAVSLCNYFSEMKGFPVCYDLQNWNCDYGVAGLRLPTEAEWEFAARGGREGGRFPWPDSDFITHERANYKAGPRPGETLPPPYDLNPTYGLHPTYASLLPPSSPVGSFAPNPYGLYDMCGNVWEWVWDWSARYLKEHQINPTGPAEGTFRVFRGGAWQTTAERNTVSVRYTSARPTASIRDVGFRYVLPIKP